MTDISMTDGGGHPTSAKPYLTAPVASKRMPGGIPYIIGNEAAERFSFYGMKAVLTVYMVQYLHLMGSSAGTAMTDAAAKEKFHLFTAAVYFTPIFGAVLSDAFLGKYRTIMLLSMVYCAGHAALAFMGVTGSAEWWLFAGLVLISFGSGGIKPCVSAHVGDQFGKTNGHLVEKTFNFFYFAINFGAFLSTILTPYLLEWYGPHLAFGVPGVLMAIATGMFWMGRHKFVHIPPGGFGFLRELFSKEGLFALLKLSIIYIFVAVFWALFDQTGSSWVLQAEDMDRDFLGIPAYFGFDWLPSQIQAVNPILILLFIPIFTFGVYPAINKVWQLTPLRKIAMGLFVMIGGFGVVALAQSWIDAGETPSVGWQLLGYALLTASEVMVSITCLEFSYTQAPKKMKSIVMAFFLCSVSVGNFFTAGVNHFIQVPDGTAAIESVAAKVQALRAELGSEPIGMDWSPRASELDGFTYRHLPEGGYSLTGPGPDGETGTEDDVTVAYGAEGGRESIKAPGLEVVKTAAERIDALYRAQGSLPLTADGGALLADLKDSWGGPIRYLLINSKKFRVSSDGPDREHQTVEDRGYVVDVPSLEEQPKDEAEKPATWLERRKAELGIEEKVTAEGDIPTTDFTAFVGGQTKLEGASYFWFFTQLMAATAILFVVVAFLYKPKEYLQDEAPPGTVDDAIA